LHVRPGGLATDPYLWPAQATKAALRQAGLCYVARKTFVGQTPTPKYKADLSPPIGRLLVTDEEIEQASADDCCWHVATVRCGVPVLSLVEA